MAFECKKNWFPTLIEALDSENLIEVWPFNKSLSYGESFDFTFDDGSRNGRFVSIYRDTAGNYERPITYKR